MKKVLLYIIILLIGWAFPVLKGEALRESTTLSNHSGTAVPFGEKAFSAVQPGSEGLPQFRSGGQVLGFQPGQVYIAGAGYALIEEFVDPVENVPWSRFIQENKTIGSNSGVPGETFQERMVYPDLWKGISAVYESRQGVMAESTFLVNPGAEVGHIRIRYNTRVKKMADGSLNITPSGGRGYVSLTAPVANAGR